MRRSLRSAWVLAFALPAVTAVVAAADTVRLKSGDVLEGGVLDLGDHLQVATPGGVVSLRWKDVDAVLTGRTPADVFIERRDALVATDATGLYALGLWAARAGLETESRSCFQATLKSDPEHAGAREALAQQKAGAAWLDGSKLLAAKGFVARDGAWMLKEEADLRARQAESRRELTTDEKRAEDLITKAGKGPEVARRFAVEALASLPADATFRPALRALRGGEPGSRVAAARALGRIKDDTDILRPLIRSAVMDRDATVRAAAASSLREIGNGDVVKPIAKAMWSSIPDLRANAAEALGEIGGAASVEWLVLRVASSGGPSARNHIFVGTQVTYVSDFDVEIAQAAQIGDPIVQTIREGAMLDVKVVNVREEFTIVERRVLYTQLRKTTGRDIGDDPQAWKDWFETEGRAALAAAK
ncbi:MAG: HEAT repeat domain-containing protein [Planctomycetes bacterium]|nr:HEAT repeat domain-containing protein [Planctomycetota bacterium]